MPAILFVSTSDQYRSPLAAAQLKQLLHDEGRLGTWYVASAGLSTVTGTPVAPLAHKLAQRCGLNLKGHRTQKVSPALLLVSDLILVMEVAHKEALLADYPYILGQVYLLSEVVDGDLYDIPGLAGSVGQAEENAEELCSLIRGGYPSIMELAAALSALCSAADQLVESSNSVPGPGVPRKTRSAPAPKILQRHAGFHSSKTLQAEDGRATRRGLPFHASTTRSPAGGKRSARLAIPWRGLLALLISTILLLGWGGFKLWQVRQLVDNVEMDIGQLKVLLQSPPERAQLEKAERALSVLNQDLQVLEDQVGPWLWIGPLLRWVPVYGGDLASAGDLLTLANHMVLLGDQSIKAVQPLVEAAASNPAGSTVDLVQLVDLSNQAQPGLVSARATLEQAKLARQRITLQQLSPPLQRLVSEEVDPALSLMDDSLTLAASLPSIFGMGSTGPRTYLLLVENKDELRPSGGFISAVGTLVIKDGEVISLTFEDSGQMEDWSKPYPLVPWQLEQYMNSPVLVLRDSNWFVDYPTSAAYAQFLYKLGKSGPVNVDGVIAFNQNVLISLLEVVGPIQLEGAPDPITAANVEEYMREAKTPPPAGEVQPDWYRKAFIAQITQALLDRMLSGNVEWNKLSMEILRLLDERQILLQISDAEAARVFADRGWDGAVVADYGDYLYVVSSNIGFNKTNAVVTQELTYDVDLSDLTHPTGLLSVSQSNHASADVPCNQWDEGQITDELWYPIDRCYWDYLRVYQSSQAALVDSTPHAVPEDWTIQGHAVPPKVDLLDDELNGVQGYGTLVVLPGGQSLTTTFKFALPQSVIAPLPDSDQSLYRLKIQKQAGTLAVPVTVRIHFPRHTSLLSTPAGSLIQDNNLMVQANLTTDLVVEVVVRLP